MTFPRLLLLAGMLACGGTDAATPGEVTVLVRIPEADGTEQPAAGIGLVALPYDRDSVIAALDAKAGIPRPGTAALDSLYRRFQKPFSGYAALTLRTARLRDSLAALRRQLDSLPRSSPSYADLYQRFGRQAVALRGLERQRDSAQKVLDAARRSLAGKDDTLRQRIRQWEDSAYREYEPTVEQLVRRAGRQPIGDTTDAGGQAAIRLTGGPWWIYARAWDAADPNAEWYWNLRVTGERLVLDSRSGQRRPRY